MDTQKASATASKQRGGASFELSLLRAKKDYESSFGLYPGFSSFRAVINNDPWGSEKSCFVQYIADLKFVVKGENPHLSVGEFSKSIGSATVREDFLDVFCEALQKRLFPYFPTTRSVKIFEVSDVSVDKNRKVTLFLVFRDDENNKWETKGESENFDIPSASLIALMDGFEYKIAFLNK